MYKPSLLRKPDPQGIHVIDSSGEAIWLSTPFTVSIIDAVGIYKPDTVLVIWEVGYTSDGQMMFVIDNRVYPSDMFILLLS